VFNTAFCSLPDELMFISSHQSSAHIYFMLLKFMEWNSCDFWHQQTSCANMKDSNRLIVQLK